MKNFIWLFAALILMASCTSENAGSGSKKGDDEQPYVVCTTGMVADLVRNITGDKMEVVALMGPGVDPHLYKATQGDLQKLTKADAVIYNGLFLEGKMEDIFKKMGKDKMIYAVADGLNKSRLLKSTDEESSYTYDPHIWFNVDLWKQAIQPLRSALQELDPDNGDFYLKNANQYEKVLEKLHFKAAKLIEEIPVKQRTLISSHDAFGYFGDAYDVEVKGLQGMSTTAEFGLQDVKNLVDYITSKKIKAVFVESSVPSKPMEAVIKGCKERGHEVKIGGKLFSDAMGKEGTDEGTYVGMVKHNINAINNALK